MARQGVPMRGRVIEFILIVVACILAALLARYWADHGIVPEEYVLPIYAIIVLVGGYLVVRIVNGILDKIVQPTLGLTHTHGLKNFFELLSGIVIIVIIFAIFGFNLTGALVGAGFLGIVLGLAAQQVLGNIFAGLSLLFARPFEIGDRVTLSTSTYGVLGSTYAHETQISGFTGVVQDVGIFFTRVLLENGIPAVFPNSVVIGSLMVNHSRITMRSVRVRMDLSKSLDYDMFKTRVQESLKRYDVIDASKLSLEIVDVGPETYQVVITAWTQSMLDEPIRTVVIREAMKVREGLSGTRPS